MKKPEYIRWILLAEAVGILSGLLSREGIAVYGMQAAKPPLTPPAAVFPVVWTILYALMGIGAARISAGQTGSEGCRGLNLFVAQLVVNFFWSLIFFRLQAYGPALAWLILLWVLVAAMILCFRKVDVTAALLQIPYLLWLTFAAYLNYGVWKLNA